jgi:hypothetical protein
MILPQYICVDGTISNKHSEAHTNRMTTKFIHPTNTAYINIAPNNAKMNVNSTELAVVIGYTFLSTIYIRHKCPQPIK